MEPAELPPGSLKNQRHPQQLVVEGVRVPAHPAVLPELLAVIRGEDDQGVFVEPAGSQQLDELPDRAIHLSDLRVVGTDYEIEILIVDLQFTAD